MAKHHRPKQHVTTPTSPPATGSSDPSGRAGIITSSAATRTKPKLRTTWKTRHNEIANSHSYGISGISTWTQRGGGGGGGTAEAMWSYMGIPGRLSTGPSSPAPDGVRGTTSRHLSRRQSHRDRQRHAGEPTGRPGAAIDGNAGVWWADADDTPCSTTRSPQGRWPGKQLDGLGLRRGRLTYGKSVQLQLLALQPGGSSRRSALSGGEALAAHNARQNDARDADFTGNLHAPIKFFRRTGHETS